MPALRFLPERTDFFVSFRAAGTNVAEAARLLTDLVTGRSVPIRPSCDCGTWSIGATRSRTRSSRPWRAISLRRSAIEDIRALAQPARRRHRRDRGRRPAAGAVSPASRDRGGAPADAHHPGAGGEPGSRRRLIEHGKHRDALERHVAEIHRLETEADEVLHHGLAGLYDGVTAIPALVHAMSWGEVYGLLEDTTDRAETVANTLQGIMEQQV